MSQTWLRFDLLNNVIVIGAINIPKECPPWFSDKFKEINTRSLRAVAMAEVSPLEFLEEACLQNRGIRLFRPLSPRSVPEPVFVPQSDLDKALAARPKDADGPLQLDPSKIKILSLDQVQRLPKEAQLTMRPIRAEALGLQPRTSVVYDAIINVKQDVESSFTLTPWSVSSYIQIRDEETINKIAQHAYADLNDDQVIIGG